MTLRQKLCLIAIGIQFIAILYLKECKNGESSPTSKSSSVVFSGGSSVPGSVLSRTVRSSTSSGGDRKEVKIYVPTEGKITITPKDPKVSVQDVVEFKTKSKGFTNRLGFKAAYPTYFGGDVKVVYWNRFGGMIGTGYRFDTKHMDLDIGASYKLDSVLPVYNLELYTGYGFFGETYVVGFRINL